VGTFFRELLRVGVYKRSQGRITRQVTFAGLVVVIVLGLLRLSQMLYFLDPTIAASKATVECKAPEGRIEIKGDIAVAGYSMIGADRKLQGKATIAADAGDSLRKIAEDINAQRAKTGVAAAYLDGKLVITSTLEGSDHFVEFDAPKDMFEIQGLNSEGVARGQDTLNLGLRYLIPGVLLAIFVWISYRLVNVPSFADFLIAVEAEVNKVSWPTRAELVRASMMVLLLIFTLAIILAAYDFAWNLLFRNVLHIL
jgi:preprotein translocase SecE subunit